MLVGAEKVHWLYNNTSQYLINLSSLSLFNRNSFPLLHFSLFAFLVNKQYENAYLFAFNVL